MSGQLPDGYIFDAYYGSSRFFDRSRQGVHPAAQRAEDELAAWCAERGYAMAVHGGAEVAVTITRNGVAQLFRADRRHDAITLATSWALGQPQDGDS